MADISSVSSGSSSSLTTNSTSTTTSATSTPSGTGSSSLLRISGMASGLNVDQIVTQLCTPYQLQIDQVQQHMQTVQWKQQMYTNIISDIKNFQNTYLNVAAPDTNITSASFFNTKAVTSSDSNSVSVTAQTSAVQGSYNVTVNSLAKPAAVSGNSLNTEIQVTNNDITKWSGKKIDFNIGGSSSGQITMDNLTSTGNAAFDCQSLVNNINKQLSQNPSLSGKVSASYVVNSNGSYIKFTNASGTTVQITGSDVSDINPQAGTTYSLVSPTNVISTNTNTTLSQLGFSGNEFLNISYNNTEYSVGVNGTETIGQLIQDINSKTSGQVSAKLDDITGSFVLQTAQTGSANTLTIKNASSDSIMQALGLNSLPTDSNGIISPINGADASVTISQPGGDTETVSEASNSFTINGVNFNINNITSSPVNVTVASNSDSVATKFKAFMDKYNSIITEINTKLNEKVSFDYPPLTTAQKSQMNASDIQSWNTQAQVGLLHGDDKLSSMLSELKDTLYNSVQGVISSAGSKIGFDLSPDYTTDGTLVFTDGTGANFEQALQDPTCDIVNLFTKSPGALTGTDKYNNEGIFQRMNDVFTKYTGGTGVTSNNSILGAMANKQDNYSIYGFGSDNTFLDQIFADKNKINELQQTYNDKRNQYYKQFTDLETAMNQLNSQSAALTQQSSGG